jgi:hypothetical protein
MQEGPHNIQILTRTTIIVRVKTIKCMSLMKHPVDSKPRSQTILIRSNKLELRMLKIINLIEIRVAKIEKTYQAEIRCTDFTQRTQIE